MPQEPLPPAPVPGVPRLRRGWLLGVAIVPLLAGLGWFGYQELEGQTKGSNDQEVNQPTGEAPVIQAGDPVLEPKQVSSPEVSPAPAIEPEPTPKLSAYERALQLPGVEKVPSKQGSGSLKLVLDLGNGNKLTLLWIAPGEFRMGSPTTDPERFDDEVLHKVVLTQGYFLGQTEITQGQWLEAMDTAPWEFNTLYEGEPDSPAYCISYEDAVKFCNLLNNSEQQTLRPPEGWCYCLPTEAHWEYACRAGSESAYCSGDLGTDLDRVAVYLGDMGLSREMRVASKSPNDWGLFDMHGSLSEWTADAWSDGMEFRDGQENPLFDAPGSPPRVVRGGSWFDFPRECRSAFRDCRVPGHPYVTVGIRLCLLPDSVNLPEAR